MKLLSKFGVFFDHILSICAWLACGCIIFSMMSINADVILRQFFKLPLIWVLEVNEYLLLYVTFLGTAWVLRDGGHTSMDILLVRFKPVSQIRFNAFTSIFGAIACLILGWSSGLSTWKTHQAGWYYENVLMAPYWIMHIVVSIGFLLLFIQFSRRAHQLLIMHRAPQKEKDPE